MWVSVCMFHLALWEVCVSNTNAVFATESVCVLWYRTVILICGWRCAFSHGCSLDVGATLVCVNRSIYHTGDYARHVCAQWCSMSALVCGFQCCVYLVTVSHNFQCVSQAESRSWFKEKFLNLFNKRIKYKYVKSTIYVVAYLLTWKKRHKHLELTGLAVGALIRQSPQVFQAGLRNTDFLRYYNSLTCYPFTWSVHLCPIITDCSKGSVTAAYESSQACFSTLSVE